MQEIDPRVPEAALPDNETPLTKAKKPRTEKQIAAFQKCQDARANKAKSIRETGTLQPPKVRRDHVYNLQTDMLEKQDMFLGKMNGLFDEFAELQKASATYKQQQTNDDDTETEDIVRAPPKIKRQKASKAEKTTESQAAGIAFC
jgi:hypothetical protein